MKGYLADPWDGSKIIIALLLILLGFGMIIMPAPHYFEMFTLFYLNPNDGFTFVYT